jgi:glycosyltransferase involved in cell wall biosynthesis
MPVYNERGTLRYVVERVLAVAPMDLELICVDDGSTDGSGEVLQELQADHEQVRVHYQPQNQGSGAG